MKQTFTRLLRSLSETHGGSAAEHRVRQCLRSELNCDGEADKTGNLCFYHTGRTDSPLVMLAAHMDEVGLAVHSVTQEGYVRFVAMGGAWSPALLAQRFRLLTRSGDELLAVVASKPVHMLSESEKQSCPSIESMFLDVGADSAQQATDEFGIRPGDPLVPDAGFKQLGSRKLFTGKGFDDRAGLAVGAHVFKRLTDTHPNTVCLAGTVQEEIGCRGAETVCSTVNPDMCVILEGAPADDLPGSARSDRQGMLGRGPQIRVMDSTAVMNRGLTDLILDTAVHQQIDCQTAVRRSGATDAKNIHLAGEGVPCAVIGIPVRYIHTPHCVLNIDDCLNAVRLLEAVIGQMDRDTVEGFTAF